jgi:hypothetical protein
VAFGRCGAVKAKDRWRHLDVSSPHLGWIRSGSTECKR